MLLASISAFLSSSRYARVSGKRPRGGYAGEFLATHMSVPEPAGSMIVILTLIFWRSILSTSFPSAVLRRRLYGDPRSAARRLDALREWRGERRREQQRRESDRKTRRTA